MWNPFRRTAPAETRRQDTGQTARQRRTAAAANRASAPPAWMTDTTWRDDLNRARSHPDGTVLQLGKERVVKKSGDNWHVLGNPNQSVSGGYVGAMSRREDIAPRVVGRTRPVVQSRLCGARTSEGSPCGHRVAGQRCAAGHRPRR